MPIGCVQAISTIRAPCAKGESVDINTGTLPTLEQARRRLAIRLVTALSGAGLLLVLAAWIFGA
jgi:hypothetical protein